MRLKVLPVLILLVSATQLSSQQTPAPSVDFVKQVQPIFVGECSGCHRGATAPAGLQLDTVAGLMQGSGSGKVIVPGNAKQSLLVQRVSDTTGNQMPPNGPLSAEQIRLITAWVNEGAKTEGAATGTVVTRKLPPPVSTVTSSAVERTLLDGYCVTCHQGPGAPAGLQLDKLDTANVEKDAGKWELVVRKLRAGMMPPAGNPRPDAKTYEAAIVWLEGELDRHHVAEFPPPGVHRLNRTEYANAVRDVLGLEIDPAKFLPSDDSTRGFDNIAGALSLSPALLEGYTAAAEKISRLAIGDATEKVQVTFRVPSDTSQDYHIDGLPFGTRGGLLAKYEFPADGDYVFKVFPINQGLMDNNRSFGEIKGEKLELMIDGERVKVYDWDKEVSTGAPVHGGTADVHFQVKAGLHTIGVTFIASQLAPGSDINEHFLRSTLETGGLPGFKFWPHVGKVEVLGPTKGKIATDSPSRAKIFVCKPASPAQENTCARQIVSTLARHAYRRPVTNQDTEMLMGFYQQGRNEGTFDSGIERAIQRVLSDPEFAFRKEIEPAGLAAGKTYPITDMELASRLSFFLWSSVPDDELINLAAKNKLHEPAVLEQQVRRMLSDGKSDQLVVNFAGQWLNLRAMQTASPIPGLFPDFDDNLRAAMRKETELFVGSVIHEDRNVMDLIDANYTYLNERLAKHYGIPNIYGSNFRRVELPAEFDMRRGLLGQGSLETVSGYPNRTSPTVRGKAMMKIFLGVSPPDPPPNVPKLSEDASATHSLTKPTMRQQMEMHRANEPCATCHKIMDPIGFSLENFDAIGKWRVTDDGSPINPNGQLVDGSPLDGVKGLREAFVRSKPQFMRVVTENLLIYALGRGTEYFDMPLVRSIVKEADQNNDRFSSLVLGIVKSDQFLKNQKIQVGANGQQNQLRAGVLNQPAQR
jgi:mono/diheme cytochrome c family protein